MTQHQFVAAVLALPFTLAAGLWAYAFSLCQRTGRLWLTAGLYLIFEPREGRHVMYEDEPVTIRDQRTEDEKKAAYAAMRAETEALPVTPSAAPYTAWTAALHPTDIDDLRALLEDEVRAFHARIDRTIADFLHERTDEQTLIPV